MEDNLIIVVIERLRGDVGDNNVFFVIYLLGDLVYSVGLMFSFDWLIIVVFNFYVVYINVFFKILIWIFG